MADLCYSGVIEAKGVRGRSKHSKLTKGIGRPRLTHAARNRWALMVSKFVSQGLMYFVEACEEARAVYKESKQVLDEWDGEFNEELDKALWDACRDKLYARAGAILTTEPGRRDQWIMESAEAREAAFVRQLLLDGACPRCGSDVSEGDPCGHGFGRPRIDGKGGVVVDGLNKT